MTVPHFSTSAILLLRDIGYYAEDSGLKVSHGLSVAKLSNTPGVAYARMDTIFTKSFNSSNFRDIVAQLSGKEVLGVVYDFENYSLESAIRFSLDNIRPAEQDFNIKRFCYSPNFGSNFHLNLVDYFGSASREGDRWREGSLTETMDSMISRIKKNLIR